MKPTTNCSRFAAVFFPGLAPWLASAAVITTNTTLDVTNASYDGLDLVVSNAVLTVDGPHAFNSLRVASGAMLTHSAAASGILSFTVSVTNEAHVLTDINPVTLANPDVVLASVLVRDPNNLVTYTNEVDYVLTSVGSAYTLQRTTNSFIPDGDTVWVSYDFLASTNTGLALTITNDFELEPGALVQAVGRGRGGGQGPGAGGSGGNPFGGAGGGHGGLGGTNSGGAFPGAAHGSAQSPTALGGGGGTGTSGPGAWGGGAVRLDIGGHCVLNGLITADGENATNSRAGAGAGGSVWITAQTISGGGQISAQGGAGEPIHGGGGGGGRIALEFQTNFFAGSISTIGGAGWQRGGAGSIFIRSNGTVGTVTFDNGGFAGAATLLSFSSAPALIIQGGANAVVSSAQPLASLIVRSNSLVTTSVTNNATLWLTVQGSVTIEAGSVFSMAGRGFSPGTGNGAGAASATVGSGAGHGGYGGSGIAGATIAAGGLYYGSITGGATFGSGGRSVGLYSGGPGGGAVRLTVNGRLQLDGKISADGLGSNGNSGGGGAGGSVWLAVGTFSGSGAISANGGAGGTPGNGGGGGGGGRIAITYNTNLFAGNLSAAGGNGGVPGAAGTIYTKLNASSLADLRADNHGLAGTNTILDALFSCNVRVDGAAALRTPVTGTLFFGRIEVGTNSSFTFGGGGSPIFVSSNITIAASGVLSGDGMGGTSGTGSGPGQYSPSGSGGAGHGGYGGRGLGAVGGNVSGTASSASTSGSGGGGGTESGGPGGGLLNLTCSGNILVDGRISANGLDGAMNSGGGGAGGGLRITVNQLSGAGIISADGGSGHLPNGGGGGGGRIAIFYTSNFFTGTFSAKGGNGFVPGGAGTIYLKANSSSQPKLIIDNGGRVGTNTILDVTSIQDLSVLPGATLTPLTGTSWSIGNLNVASNATLRFNTALLNISGTATIAAGGVISADEQGTSGPGSGNNGGGAGHGGYGGRGTNVNAAGGNVFDSTSSPAQPGSPASSSFTSLSRGGGALRLVVGGPLILDGRIRANGGNALSNTAAGGGSGGSVWLTLNQFSGSGDIAADGGGGLLVGGGGGGGGRIAIYYNSNAFTGTLSAKGGPGFVAGGAGTIYLKQNSNPTPSLLVDNGGLTGTNTLLDVITLSNLSITGGALLKAQAFFQPVSLDTLNVGSNSALLAAPSGPLFTLNISGAANIAAGGAISGDGIGSASGSGSGPGQTASGGSGGGGHAGYGGRGLGNAPVAGSGAGGNAYDSLLSPSQTGSGGGGNNSSGGAGGGAIRIEALGRAPFRLDGRISANGFNAYSNNAGGGAGGSVWLTLNELIGTGTITADGGNGHLPVGGGGGGGRISVSYIFTGGNTPSNGFTGSFSARGGNGHAKGGAGTLYLRTNNSSTAVVIVDNGGARGTNTLVSGSSGFDLFVQDGASATSIGSPRDLFVRSNSLLVPPGNLTVTRNATFAAGGGIHLDGLSTFNGGNGSTSANPKGGASHGGYGALNPANAGNAYDSARTPSLGGSAGGNGSGSTFAPLGGLGGGAVHLTVGNTLAVDGEISADGLPGDLNSGGGSGGAVWLQALTLSGTGQITATGGNGHGPAGGGGGGRIAIYATSNLFAGTVSACGGSGGIAGGAGTIFLRHNSQHTSLLLDNCGLAGTNTPLSSSIGLATDVAVTGGAAAEFRGAIPAFSNLVVAAGSLVTANSADPNLYLALFGDLRIHSGGGLAVDGKGFGRATGPGAGATLSSKGAGGGYGGAGGASASGAGGGITYGSATMPVDRGSGGGAGFGSGAGSEGGGALRLAVAGTVALDGFIAANGAMGLQDDAGGGAGGSVWISAGKFTGQGTLAAEGGDGDLFGGGGGGGGRIAIYSPLNSFTGRVSVAAGGGASSGGAGTVFTAGSLSGFDVAAQTPLGVVSNAVSQITLEFTEPINPLSAAPEDFQLFTPDGTLDSTNFTLSFPAPATLQLIFPMQTLPGDYRLEAGPNLSGLLGVPMSQVFTGAFTAYPPLLSGTVTATNGQPVAGVLLQPDGDLRPAKTDAAGHYALGVPAGWTGIVTPVFGNFMFAPGSRSYAGVAADTAGQDYLLVATLAPSLQIGSGGTNLFLNWSGLSGVTYQVFWSTNLSDATWYPLDGSVAGTNGLMQLEIPITDEPEKYFRLNAQN